MAVRARISYTHRPDALPELVREAASLGMRDALLYWHEEFRPRHFLNQARGRYGYQPRLGDDEPPTVQVEKFRPNGTSYYKTISNPHYSWQKRRILRHNLPLVWSGLSAKLSEQVRITATRGQAKLAFTGLPKYFYQYLKAGTYYRRLRDGRVKSFTLTHDQPRKFEELVIVIDAELAEMAVVADGAISKYLAASRSSTTVSL